MRVGFAAQVAGLGIGIMLGAGCGGDGEVSLGGPRTPFPSFYCPGSPGCTGMGDNVLRVGAARALINPDLPESEWDDANGDSEWEPGESFTDVNGNGKFDAVWIAGFGNGRPARGFHSDLSVRVIVLEWNDIRIAIAIVDAVGWMLQEIKATRALLEDDLQLDHVLIGSTHLHEGPDTVGLWGSQELVPGTDPAHMAYIRQQTAVAIREAVGKLEPVSMSFAQVETVDASGSTRPYVGDNRDPIIIDPTLTVMQFQSVARAGETVASIVHWAAHAEYSGSKNNMLTADFVDQLRDVIQNGIAENTTRGLPALTGLGGEVVFVNGALGGQIGPNKIEPIGPDGQPMTEDSLELADSVGRNVARLALEAATDSAKVVDIPSPALAVRTGTIDLAVENTFYHVASLVGVFDRQFHGQDDNRPLGPDNVPYIESQVTYLQIGSVGIITSPGELHPELFFGGYDGSRSYGRDIISSNNPNPPPLANAPQGPYLKDVMLEQPGVEHALLFGLVEDFVGYIPPSYNYQLNPSAPYIDEADGDHYEETNSVGPLIEEQALGSMRELVIWKP